MIEAVDREKMAGEPKSVCITFSDLAGNVGEALEAYGRLFDVYTNRDLEANLRTGIREIAGKKYDRAFFLVRDLRHQGRLIRYRTLLVLSGAREKRIVDLKGNTMTVTRLSFALRDVPRALVDYVSSYIVVAYTYLLIQGLLAAGRKHARPGDVEKIAYLRTDHMFGVGAGGSVGHVAGVANGLHGLGYGLFFISTDRLALVDENETPVHIIEPSYSLFNALTELPEIAYNFRLVREGSRIFRKERPDAVYQRYSRNNYAAIRLARRFGIPLITEYNGSFVWMARNWEDRRAFRRTMEAIELANLMLADLVVVVSEASKQELLGRGIPEGRILVNPNGVDPEIFSPAVDGRPVRKKYGLDGKVVVGFIGTFGPWHGTDVLAGVVKDVVRANPQVHFLLIGDGYMMVRTREIIRNDGVGQAVTFTGLVPQAEARSYLAACDVLASPTVPNPDGTPFFGSPTKLFEYMAMGKAIVASDLDQPGDVLEDGRTALLVRPGDAGMLAEAVIRLASDEALRDRLGKGAREEAVRSYTWRGNARKVMDALKAISSRERGG